MKKLLIWGAGDQGIVTLDCALAMKRYGVIEFLEIKEKGRREIPGYVIYGEDEACEATGTRGEDEACEAAGTRGEDGAFEAAGIYGKDGACGAAEGHRETVAGPGGFLRSYDEVIVATGNNDLREQKTSLLRELGITLASLIHPTAVISPSARVSEGCTVLANAVINANAVIGTGCIINTAAVVEHDCVIGDFVNISPNASMAGHTRIGRKSFLGIGCTIIDDIAVGQGTVVGAGAVVIRDVPDEATVVGVPARVINE